MPVTGVQNALPLPSRTSEGGSRLIHRAARDNVILGIRVTSARSMLSVAMFAERLMIGSSLLRSTTDARRMCRGGTF